MTIHVSAAAEMTGDGTRLRPFRTIQEAADAARPGDTVLVADGVYREHVRPRRSGTAERPIVYRAVNPRRAVVSGAEPLTGWERAEGGPEPPTMGTTLWRTVIPGGIFGDYNPFTTLLAGDWIRMEKPLHTGLVFMDDRPLSEVASREELRGACNIGNSPETEETAGFWYAEALGDATVITANFRGEDPGAHRVEITVRANCFMPAENEINHITVRGFHFTRTATQWAPPTAYQDGAVGPHWSRGWVIEDCEISWSRCSGISLGKYLQPGNENKWSRSHVKHGTQTERDAVCQAVNEGWSKERIGSHVVRNCEIHDCGQTGIVGHMGGVFSLIENNHIHHINSRHDIGGAEIAGIKLHAAIDTVIAKNHIHHCTRGLWLDWQAQGTRVTANFFHDNTVSGAIPGMPAWGEDLFIEVSHGPTLVDNNVLLSAHAARLTTQGAAFVHNLIAGSFTGVGRGVDNGAEHYPSPRYTPYHVPHDTKIAGFMTILHGDMRFYNNVFIQRAPLPQGEGSGESSAEAADAGAGLREEEFPAGTKPYDGYPTPEEYFSAFTEANIPRDLFYEHLPVTCRGNAYFGGARPCDVEEGAYVDDTHRIALSVRETPEGVKLSTDLYAYLPRDLCGAVSTETLGEAFEPEQLFEAPDGSPILFSTDYRGAHRGIHPLCGPFETDGAPWSELVLVKKGGRRRERSLADSLFGEEEATEGRLSYTDGLFGGGDTGGRGESGAADGERAAHPETGRPEGERAVNSKTGEARSRRESMSEEDPEEAGQPVDIGANLVLLHCEACTFPMGGEPFTVQEVYIRRNEVWITNAHTEEVVYMDCEYGFFRHLSGPVLRAPFSVDVTEDKNLLGIVNTLATLFRILSRNLVQDPAEVCARIRERANEGFAQAQITMRLTPQTLKFIRGKRFITLEEVIDTVALPDEQTVGEVVDRT